MMITLNDGKGVYDKYGMIDEMMKKIDLAADARGVVRAGLMWDVYCMLKRLKTGLENEEKQEGDA